MKDFYAILHVLPSADLDVIKAAYKALARKYHPDTFVGDKTKAGRMMQEINDAYSVISDPAKRKTYDNERAKNNDKEEYSDGGEEVNDPRMEEDWLLACKYCPEAKLHYAFLSRLSYSLGFTYKSYMLDAKCFDNSSKVASQLQKQFLNTYFGANLDIQSFARDLILVGELQAAKSVNRAVKVMGKSLELTALNTSIYSEHPSACARMLYFNAIHLLDNDYSWDSDYTQTCVMKLLSDFHVEIKIKFFGGCALKYKGQTFQCANSEMRPWIVEHLGNELANLNIWTGPLLKIEPGLTLF